MVQYVKVCGASTGRIWHGVLTLLGQKDAASFVGSEAQSPRLSMF